jgi:hypothetical protein
MLGSAWTVVRPQVPDRVFSFWRGTVTTTELIAEASGTNFCPSATRTESALNSFFAGEELLCSEGVTVRLGRSVFIGVTETELVGGSKRKGRGF